MHLLREVEKFLNRSQTAPTRFGRDAVGDPRFVFDLRNGREPRPSTVTRVRAFWNLPNEPPAYVTRRISVVSRLSRPSVFNTG